MKQSNRITSLFCLGVLAAISATAPASAATNEEKAKCEQMVKNMGAATPHDHGKEKSGAPNAMTSEHERCKTILGTNGDKKGESKHQHEH